MSAIVQSDSAGVLFSREATLGVQPTSGWHQFQPNPGGIQNFTRQNVVVERHILSKNMTPERGEVVGYDVAPKLVQDLTRDVLLDMRELLYRSVTKHAGNKGQSVYRPTAVTATGFTVAALGDLSNGLLVNVQGFNTAANNGLKLLAGTSTATEIKTTGLTAEPAPPSNAVVEVAGVQGASGDLGIDASGNLTSTALDFTTLGLNVGQWVRIGDETSGAAFAFATAAYNGYARIAVIAAGKLTFTRRTWTIAGADAGAAKTVRILFAAWNRNVPIDHADYLTTPTGTWEISEPGAGTAGATDYTYVGGVGVNKFSLDVPVESKVVLTLDMVGMTVSDPGSARATGSSTALEPLKSSIFTTASRIADIRLCKQSDESTISAEVNGCKMDFSNNMKPRKQLGTSGAAGLIFGEYVPMLSLDIYVLSNDFTRAVNANTDCTFDLVMKTSDGGVLIDYPMVKLRKGDKTYAANDSVMLAADIPANRDPSSGILYSMSHFAYLP